MIENLLGRVIRVAQNPRTRNLPVSNGRAERWQWNEPAGEIDEDKPFVLLILEVPEEDKQALKYIDLSNTLWGVSRIWVSWPELDFECKILGRGKELGKVQLVYTDEQERYETASVRNTDVD
ncbi:MAG: hypothetical protein Q9186_007482 [Xanthomendoza sp. 1 TL-2023]